MEQSPAKSSPLDPRLLAEARRLELRTRRTVSADLVGRYRSSFRGSGLIFSDLREYQPGDDVKQIHWKATARTGHVYVKSYIEERSLNITLALDTSASTLFGAGRTNESTAREFAALVSLLAMRSQDALGLCLFAERVRKFLPPRRDRPHLEQVLYWLTQPGTPAGGTDVAAALEHLRAHQKRRGIIFVISDFFSPPFEDPLRALAFRNDVICVQIQQPGELELPRCGLVELRDPESGERRLIDTSSARVRRAVKRAQIERRAELQAAVNRAGATLITVEDHPLPPLAALMERRAQSMR